MIELPHPGDPGAPQPPARRGRGPAMVAAAVLVVVVLVVALVNGHRNRNAAGSRPDSAVRLSPAPSASPSAGRSTPNGGGLRDLPVVACPQIRDEQSHLGYRCIDNYLEQDGADTFLGLRISLNHEVEPDWVITEGSGNPRSLASPAPNTVVSFAQPGRAAGPGAPTTAQVSAEVRRRTGLALEHGYGDDPSSATLAAHPRSFAGVTGYELLTEITINPAYRAAHTLKVRTERLWTVGLPTPAGISIFMLSIPDARSDLWPKAEATIGTVHVL
jgi:hypothetical protein